MSDSKAKTAELIKLYNNLPSELKDKIYNNLKIASSTNSKAMRESLALVNKSIGRNYQPLTLLRSVKKSPNNLQKTVNVVGDFPINTLLNRSPVAEEINRVFDYNMPQSKEEKLFKFDGELQNENFKEDKSEYIKKHGLTKYNEMQEEWENYWNYIYSHPKYYSILEKDINILQSDLIEYDNSKKTKKNMQEFLDLPANPTFKEYATAIKKLPFSVKLQMGL